MKICPKCGKVLSYNSYFGAYICADCKWEDASFGIKRNKGYYAYSIYTFKKNKEISARGVIAKSKAKT